MELTLTHKEHLIGNIWAFRFQPSEPLEWIAGQYVQVELPHDNPDEKDTMRWFTVSSAPYEGEIQITTRISDSSFKQVLAALPIGDNIQLLQRPDGDFIWQDSDLPLVFVAGGIGITPFHAILKQRAHEGLPLSATLVYASRDGEVPFKDELEQWSASNSGLAVQYVTGEPLSAPKLIELVPNITGSLVYIAGPEPLVDSLTDDLIKHGVPQSQLRRDPFLNYTLTNY